MVFSVRNLVKLWNTVRALEGAFDPVFYRSQSSEFDRMSDKRLLRHYCVRGWQGGLDPSPDFSTLYYLAANDDVARAGINPYAHYLQSGRHEGRTSCPASIWKAELDALAPHFSPSYYRAFAPAFTDFDDRMLLSHYHAEGWKKRHDPSPDFSVAYYLSRHADVRRLNADPLLHYVQLGRAEARAVQPGLPQDWDGLSEAQIALLLDYFDADFYRTFVPDQPGEARDLLKHYITTGWHAGYDPAPGFSTLYYQETYPDVGALCPLLHFVLQRHPEARRGTADAPRRLSQHPEAVPLPQFDFPHPVVTDPEQMPLSTPAGAGLDLHWVIPDFAKGGGGHMTIFRMIRHLESFGHRCTIWIDNPSHHSTPDAAYDDIIKYFQCVEARVCFLKDGFEQASGDAVIATAWTTAYTVQAARGFAGKFYFVQDYEPDFYPIGTERYLAARTYEFDLACLCASPWLAERMQDGHGRWSRGFHLAYDRAVYCNRRPGNIETTPDHPRKKIAVYAREHTARRCVHLAIMALSFLARTRTDFEVHFFGQEHLSFAEAPFVAFNHGVLDDTGLAALYNDCDIGLCFSATNYSLVPQEMMACGLPLIELDGDSTRAIFPSDVVTLAGPDPRDICAQIAALLDSAARCDQQSRAAHDWVEGFTWEGAARDVESGLIAYLEEQGRGLPAPAVIPPRELLIDVVIPTFNGMGELEPVIDALRAQKLWENTQLYCIDSSSDDGTTEWLRAQSDLSLTVIDRKDFQHGRTRNYGASLGQAPLIAFLTQDAIPAGPHWAGDLMRMMRHYPKAAGVFGRHLPYPHHPLYIRQEIERHFSNLLRYPLALSRQTDPGKWESGDRSWRQVLHFYSDNNSAMRRQVWQDRPYPEVAYGEDQLWARGIIEAGYTKLYAPTATVYHSHDYTPEQTYARCYTEAEFFHVYFGYDLGETDEHALPDQLRRQHDAIVHWGRMYQVPEAEIHRQQQISVQKYHGWRDGRLAAMRRKVSRGAGA